jgi:hypothetical protein
MSWFILSNQNGSEISRHRTLLRAVEAQELFNHTSTITRSASSEPVDQVDIEIAAEVLRTAQERRGFELFELRNYWHGMRLGTYATRSGAEAALAEQIAMDPANRINCGVEVVRQEVGR